MELNLKKRAFQHRLLSYAFLVGIIASLIIGLQIFLNAESYTIDREKKNQINSFRQDFQTWLKRKEALTMDTVQFLLSKCDSVIALQNEKNMLYDSLLIAIQQNHNSIDSISIMISDPARINIQRRRGILYKQVTSYSMSRWLHEYGTITLTGDNDYDVKPIADISQHFISADTLFKQSMDNLGKVYESERGKTNADLAVTVTRIGAILIILFLVQILVTLYRYNTKLANYYRCLDDAFTVTGDIKDIKGVQIALEVMLPNIEFDKSPKYGLEQIVEILKAK